MPPSQPAVVHVGHADTSSLLGDGLLRLLLGADEEDRPTVGDRLLDELVGAVDVRQRLLEVDDVDAVALREDETLHLRVPTTGLVSEVDTALEELAHGHDGHGTSFRHDRDHPSIVHSLLRHEAAFRLSASTPVGDAPSTSDLGTGFSPDRAHAWRPAGPVGQVREVDLRLVRLCAVRRTSVRVLSDQRPGPRRLPAGSTNTAVAP
jgi:hypothetical protein